MFMTGGGPRIELLENLPGSAMLDQFLKTGDFVFYHMGYLTDSMEETVSRNREAGGKMISPPMPATAFGGRNICFFAFAGGIIVEYIERERK